MTIIRWFISKTVREAVSLKRHVRKLLNHQRDILKPEAASAVEVALGSLSSAISKGLNRHELQAEIKRFEEVANKSLKQYAFPGYRENVEVFLVAIAVAMAIRTFFLQPFKIPTGSMQPTLYGVTSDNLIGRTDVEIPNRWGRIRDWFAGDSYVHFVADTDGEVTSVEQPVGIGRHGSVFKLFQRFTFAGKARTLWFPPDCGGSDLATRAGILRGHTYRRGEDVIKMRVRSGDHLFVDRLTYNFRRPSRGEIIVFETMGIYALPQDQFYIKRLVALGGEKVKIGNDRHLRIDGNRLDASTRHFEFVYSFATNSAPRDSRFSGHVNRSVALTYYPDMERHPLPDGRVAVQEFAPLFGNGDIEQVIPPRRLMVMGDNTMNSSDSRFWGSLPEGNVIGRSCFVYWPLSSRFGCANLFH